MKLYIDTSDNKRVKVGLTIHGREHVIEQEMDRQKSQAVLPLIEKLLQEQQGELKDIKEIHVNLGPGSFTGLRVGVAIANTLGFLLQIPVNGRKVGEMIEPVYS